MGRRQSAAPLAPAAPYLLTPSTLPAVSSPVSAHQLRGLRVRAIEKLRGAAVFCRVPLERQVYARHGREPFGPELKADGLMG